MTNICFILYDLSIIGGVERVVESLANKLSTRYVVHIISIHGKEVNPSLQFSNSIKIKLLKLDEGRLRQQLIKAFYPIKSYFKKNKIEIAFLEATFVGFIGSPLGLLSKTKIVFCDHGSFMSQYNDIEIRIIRKIASIFCNKVIVLTKRSMDDYKRYFRIKSKKIPCVSFDILTGPNEIIEDAKNGYLIKPYDIEAMAACINKMIINPDIRQELSNKSYSNINKFREINIYDQWVILINQLLSAW